MVRSWKLTARNNSGSKLMDSPRRPSVSSAKMSGEQKDDEADRPERAPDPVQPSPALEEGERVSVVERGAGQEPTVGRHDREEREGDQSSHDDTADCPGPPTRQQRRGKPRCEGEDRERRLPRGGASIARAELGPGSGRAGLHTCRMLHEGDVERPRGEQRGAGDGDGLEGDRKSTRLNSSHIEPSRMPSS